MKVYVEYELKESDLKNYALDASDYFCDEFENNEVSELDLDWVINYLEEMNLVIDHNLYNICLGEFDNFKEIAINIYNCMVDILKEDFEYLEKISIEKDD